MERDQRATLLVYAKDNPYRYVGVRGTVTMVDDPGGTLIDELSHPGQGRHPLTTTHAQQLIVKMREVQSAQWMRRVQRRPRHAHLPPTQPAPNHHAQPPAQPRA